MMKRSLYKLAILGCTSTCLMSTAYANSHGVCDNNDNDGDEVVFVELNDIGNIACDGAERTYSYTVHNTTDEPVPIFDIEILIDEDKDSFPNDYKIVTPDNIFLNSVNAGECEVGEVIPPYSSCRVNVIVHPDEVPCPTHNFLEDGEIERSLHISIASGGQRELCTPIDFDVTILGASEEYAILANEVVTDSPDGPFVTAGQVQVSQDVGYADQIDDPDDIVFHDGAILIDGFDANAAAFSDAAAAYDALRNTAFDLTNHCESNHVNLSGHVSVTPGFYCLEDIYDDDYFVVDGHVKFNGDRDSLFVFVMPTKFDSEERDIIRLEFERGADFTLENTQGRRVDANNIFWVGADEIEFDTGVAAPGTFLTKGTVFAEADAEATVAAPEGPAVITGRFLGLAGECSVPFCADDFYTQVVLNGNTINKP